MKTVRKDEGVDTERNASTTKGLREEDPLYDIVDDAYTSSVNRKKAKKMVYYYIIYKNL